MDAMLTRLYELFFEERAAIEYQNSRLDIDAEKPHVPETVTRLNSNSEAKRRMLAGLIDFRTEQVRKWGSQP